MYIVYSDVYMYSYIKKKKMGDHLNLQFPFFTSSGTRQLQNKRGGGGGGLYLSRVVRNPSRVISSGFTEYICRS